MKIKTFLVISVTLLCLTGLTFAQTDAETLVRDNNVFAFNLYKKIVASEENLIFSPYSISTVLAMTYAGAHGNTEMEMAKALNFSLEQQKLHAAFEKLGKQLKTSEQYGIKLKMANSLWPQIGYPLRDEFLNLVKNHYSVEITPLDYAQNYGTARDTISTWVERQTDNLIKDIIQPGDLSELTRLVLVNAIYFKGMWATQFNISNTKNEPFHVSPDKTVHGPMMSQQLECRYASFPEMDILELPYIGNRLAMILILPRELQGIRQIEVGLTGANLTKWLGQLYEQKIMVFLPRFKATYRFMLNDNLRSLGMVDAFSVTKADFSGIDGQPGRLYISAVIHKAFIEVNEEGTTAAASSAVVMTERSLMPRQPKIFRADHPFIFLIQEKTTGSILFAGRLYDPSR